MKVTKKSQRRSESTSNRFLNRRLAPYPETPRTRYPSDDVLGNKLYVTPEQLAAVRKRTTSKRNTKRDELEETREHYSRIADFVNECRRVESENNLQQYYREYIGNFLRRHGPEPLSLGFGQRTQAELRIEQLRKTQSFLNHGQYELDLGPVARENGWANPRFVNIATTFSLGLSEIDTKLAVIRDNSVEAFYRSNRFNAFALQLSLRTFGQVLSVRSFSTGSVSLTRAQSIYHALYAAHAHVAYLNKHGIRCSMIDFKVRNLVLMFDVGHLVQLDWLQDTYPSKTVYNPDFDTVIYRTRSKEPPVALANTSGKVVCCGAKTVDQAREFILEVYSVLSQFRCRPEDIPVRTKKSKRDVEYCSMRDMARVVGALSTEGPRTPCTEEDHHRAMDQFTRSVIDASLGDDAYLLVMDETDDVADDPLILEDYADGTILGRDPK